MGGSESDQACSAKRIPDVLELAEIQLSLSKMLGVREITLALLDTATGLRVSELLALRWLDVNFDNLELSDPFHLASGGGRLQDGGIRQAGYSIPKHG